MHTVLGPCKGRAIIAYRFFKIAFIAISGGFYRNLGSQYRNFGSQNGIRNWIFNLSQFQSDYHVSLFQNRHYRVSFFTPYRALLVNQVSLRLAHLHQSLSDAARLIYLSNESKNSHSCNLRTRVVCY